MSPCAGDKKTAHDTFFSSKRSQRIHQQPTQRADKTATTISASLTTILPSPHQFPNLRQLLVKQRAQCWFFSLSSPSIRIHGRFSVPPPSTPTSQTLLLFWPLRVVFSGSEFNVLTLSYYVRIVQPTTHFALAPKGCAHKF